MVYASQLHRVIKREPHGKAYNGSNPKQHKITYAVQLSAVNLKIYVYILGHRSDVQFSSQNSGDAREVSWQH